MVLIYAENREPNQGFDKKVYELYGLSSSGGQYIPINFFYPQLVLWSSIDLVYICTLYIAHAIDLSAFPLLI